MENHRWDLYPGIKNPRSYKDRGFLCVVIWLFEIIYSVMKHLESFAIFESGSYQEIYGVFIHNSWGNIVIGLFHETAALGLVRILEDRFGMDNDNMTGAFGPLDVSKRWIIFDDGSESGEFNIKMSEDPNDFFENSYETKKLLQNLGAFYNPDNVEFLSPENLFMEWYGEGDGLNPVDLSWQ